MHFYVLRHIGKFYATWLGLNGAHNRLHSQINYIFSKIDAN